VGEVPKAFLIIKKDGGNNVSMVDSLMPGSLD